MYVCMRVTSTSDDNKYRSPVAHALHLETAPTQRPWPLYIHRTVSFDSQLFHK